MISKFLRTNVLAIRCLEDLILVGMGYTLYIFDMESYQLREKLDCLYPSNIHGIVPGLCNILAVFGNKSICICNIMKEERVVTAKKQSIHQFNDWIISVNWISVEGKVQLAILFAHNYISIYDIYNTSSRIVYCKEKCILYGGSMLGTLLEDLTIFSGTVFQEILIWKVNNNDGVDERMPVLHRLTGHKGVIFSVIYDSDSRFICSTSDDRTVRLWKVTENENSRSNNVNWQTATVVLTKTMFAHTARVWRAVIRNDIIVTIGEDSLICTWSIAGNLLHKVYGHHGAPIWCIDISNDNRNVLTGGADGSVYAWPVASCNSSEISLPYDDMRNIPKHISYLSSGTILLFDEKGTLLYYNRGDKTPSDSLYLEKYRSYCIMQVSPCRSSIAIASIEGYVIIYKEIISANTSHLQQLVEERIMDSQIFSLQWLREDALIACGANGLLRIFNFTINDAVYVEAQCWLPPSRERWLTAAITYEELLICGDRAGNVHIYELNGINEDMKKPIQTFTKVHGKIGVQSFAILESKLMTTGRDGMLRFYESTIEDKKKYLRRLHRKKMPMDWISSTLKMDETILVLGFKEVEFIIYDLLQERILIRIPCGGGHRSWDCIVSDGTASFVYIRNKQVCVFEHPLQPQKLPILQNGFHGKETCCLRRISKLGALNIFISGGEDCTLRVSCISETSRNDSYAFRNLGLFDGHLSGIKCLSCIELNSKIDESDNKYLVFSGGGRAQLKIWEINLKYDQKTPTSVNLTCSDVKSYMLYGQDQYRRKPWQESKQSYVIEPETRYMDIYTYYLSKNYVLVFIACADGYLRLLVFDIKSDKIYLKVSTKYVDRCILKIHILPHKRKVIVLTMTTDGALRFFDFTDIVAQVKVDANLENEDVLNFSDAPFAEFGLHQSGINSFDLKPADENEYFLVTGGDDNLLNLLRFKVSEDSQTVSAAILSKWSTATAHAAQITGLRFKGKNQICSVGVDQQIIVHDYSWLNGTLSAKVLSRAYTSVADVQGMDLWYSENNDVICIYGEGFEILQI